MKYPFILFFYLIIYIFKQTINLVKHLGKNNKSDPDNDINKDGDPVNPDETKDEEVKPQPWYFHVVASFILVVHGLTFLVPHDPESEDTGKVI